MISVARVSITWVHRIIDDFRGHVELAAINAEDHSTIVGSREEMKNFRIRASIHGGVVSDVLVAGPWHSRRLVTTAEQIQAQLESIHFNPPSIPLCLGSTGEVERDPARLRRALAFNVASLIHWSKVMDSLRGQSINEFVELGPGHTLKGIARYWNPNIHSYRVHCVESSTGRLVPVPHYNQPIVHRSSSHEQA